MPKISRILIKDYRSIRKLEVEVPRKGLVAKGKNAAGKTSFLKAISAALAAQEIGPDAIRHGEDKAEIQVDIDALRVRRTISANSSQLTVTTDKGDRWTKPHNRLLELIGSAGIDPLSFFLADAKERRRQVIEAMPLKVAREQLVEWVGAGPDNDHERLIDEVGCEGHALDVVGKLRELFYGRRTEANRQAKERRGVAEQLADDPALARRDPTAKPVPEAARALAAAQARADELRGRRAGAESARASSESTRARVRSLEEQASADELAAPPEPAEAEAAVLRVRVEIARKALEAAQEELRVATAGLEQLEERRRARAGALERASRLRQQAGELAASIAGVEALAVTEEQQAQVDADLEYAQREHQRAEANQQAAQVEQGLAAAKRAAREAEDAADRLDGIVKRLTVDAPRLLVAKADVIPGLAFEGDEITLDGTPIDGLSGAEQMRFAVDLARRLNAKGKILVVDGLERLDGARLAAFIDMATADDFQLFATRVQDGDMVIEAIEP